MAHLYTVTSNSSLGLRVSSAVLITLKNNFCGSTLMCPAGLQQKQWKFKKHYENKPGNN